MYRMDHRAEWMQEWWEEAWVVWIGLGTPGQEAGSEGPVHVLSGEMTEPQEDWSDP